jgi:hypothetical protein
MHGCRPGWNRRACVRYFGSTVSDQLGADEAGPTEDADIVSLGGRDASRCFTRLRSYQHSGINTISLARYSFEGPLGCLSLRARLRKGGRALGGVGAVAGASVTFD